MVKVGTVELTSCIEGSKHFALVAMRYFRLLDYPQVPLFLPWLSLSYANVLLYIFYHCCMLSLFYFLS